MTPDSELLRQFAKTNSEDAFAELVKRHVNLVYSAALRQVGGDAHLAQDVAQTVFTDLARKAKTLSRRESLTGWLYTSAHFAAAKIARMENRRRDREEKFMREPMNETAPDASRTEAFAEAGADWEKIRPTLDDAMHELKETDREAVLLRYQLLQTGIPDPSTTLVKEIAPPVDDEYDSYHEISMNGAGGSGVNEIGGAVLAAMNAFTKNNSGQRPTTPSQITPYLQQPIDAVRIQKYLNQFAQPNQ